MKGIIFIWQNLLCLLSTICVAQANKIDSNPPRALIPSVQQVQWLGGELVLGKGVGVSLSPAIGAAEKAMVLASISSALGIKPKPVGQQQAVIHILMDNQLANKPEGYHITIEKKQVTIVGNDGAGMFYGIQTLRQLVASKNGLPVVPNCIIKDWPAFSVRGFMHDTGRNFQSIAVLKHQLQIMAKYKLNTFHWHLTDNPAWRPESKKYPALNNPKNRQQGRDPDSTYSFNQIKELIAFAKKLHIQIIPELDMPGHSAFFDTTFGVKMHTKKGMQILGYLIDEFCAEIPKEDCPMLHIGSDEVHIPNREEFMAFLAQKLKANGRKMFVWAPGLKSPKDAVLQIWQKDAVQESLASQQLIIDSYGGYLNLKDPLTNVRRHYFHPIGGAKQANQQVAGAILCCWPDIRVDDKSKIAAQNGLWPTVLAFADGAWKGGRTQKHSEFEDQTPLPGTPAHQLWQDFEQKLAKHRKQYFSKEDFPYLATAKYTWQMSNAYPIGGTAAGLPTKMVGGGVVFIQPQVSQQLDKDSLNVEIALRGHIFAKSDTTINTMLGFAAPARSDRLGTGVPQNGMWDGGGGKIWINNKELVGPKWQNPGTNQYLKHTWGNAASEIPYTDEEFFWIRKPARIALKKGWNLVVATVPKTYKDQYWMFAFVVVKQNGNQWVEDENLTVSAKKQ